MPDPATPDDLAPELHDAVTLVREDRDHGASWLAMHAAQALADYAARNEDGEPAAERLRHLHAAARAFAATRPSMTILANTMALIVDAARSSHGPPDSLLRAAADTANDALRAALTAPDAILASAREAIRGTVYTHSRSGTVEHVLRALADERRVTHLIISTSLPGGEGIALARELAPTGVPITLVADSACAAFVREADAVVVGADSVREDGSVINKVGTHPLALAAAAVAVPVLVLCESLKIAAAGFPLTLEEMSPRELLPEPVAGITARNPYFERTPAALITRIITEDGELGRQQIAARAAAMAHLTARVDP